MSFAGLSGHDPYDALRSQRVPRALLGNARARQLIIQVRKRVPFDLSGLLGVDEFVMAKAVACQLTAVSRSPEIGLVCGLDASRLAGALFAAEGNLGGGRWGYEFDVQTRWAHYPAGQPNLIATVFCGRALLTAGLALGRQAYIDEGVAAARFLAEEFRETGIDGRPYFKYARDSRTLVHNANALGCALAAAAGVVVNDNALIDTAIASIGTTLDAQGRDGTWPYGRARNLRWNDSFHTAYVLDSLHMLALATGDSRCRDALLRGLDVWMECFFGPGGEPHYYYGHHGPYDIHAAATAVDTLSRLASFGYGTGPLARRVYEWTLRHLVSPDERTTYYRWSPLFTDKRNFVRWGDGHWALARASIAILDRGGFDPIEAVAGENGGRSDEQ